MKQKLFLTSCIAMGVVAPAMAETFPSDGYMQENKTYTNAATAENMDGVYSGSVNAVAEYNLIDYILSAGQYLPKDSDTQTTCPAGSFCAGGTFQYDEDSDQGLTSCSTATSGIYALSADGAKTADECYRTCTASDVEHSKSTGTFTGMFYSNNTNACEPVNDESCANGYHYKAGPNLLTSLIGITESGEGYGYISNDGNRTSNEDTYGITQNGEFVTDYGDKGKIHGHAQCSTQSGIGMWNGASDPSDVTTSATLPDSSGRYCYCQLDSYTPAGGSATALSAPWVFNIAGADAESCANVCADNCAIILLNSYPAASAFRAAVFGSFGALPAMCEATNYMLNAGQYLPADGETPTTCPTGSYCSGIGEVQYKASEAQGIETCPTIDDATFTSDAGSSAVTACYQENSAMSTAELNPFTTAHLDTSKNGNGYINGVKYAKTTTTARRYATSATTAGEWAALDESDLEITDLACVNGYHNVDGETLYQLADLADVTGFDISVVQQLFPGKTTVTEDEIKATLTQQLLSMFVDDYAELLSEAGMTHDQFIQGYVINYLTASRIPTCEANTITINWTHADQTDIDANNAGTATYGSDVRTPVKADIIKGKTFKGWKFSKPEQTNLPN